MMKVDFGYLPEPQDFTEGAVTVATLPGLDEKRQKLEAHPRVDGRWLYSPADGVPDMLTGQVTKKPYPRRVFGLPTTHSLTHGTATEPEHLSFLVWMFGFLKGIRLTHDELGFLDATPIKTEELTDFGFFGHGERKALGYADAFWKARGPAAAKGLSAVVHALFLSRKPTLLEFEGMHFAYVALDACHAVWRSFNSWTKRQREHHAERITNLCQELGATPPPWIQDVVNARNDAMHEALFFGEPLGFAIYGKRSQNGPNVVLEMQCLISRFVCAILGLPCKDYIARPVGEVYRGKHPVTI